MNEHLQSQATGGYGSSTDMTTGESTSRPLLQLPSGFRLAQTFTIFFGVSVPTKDDGTPAPINCEATLTWVENGNQVTRKVSVANGVSISGSGTGLSVSGIDTPIGAGYVPGLKYSVSTLLAPGVRASQSQLPILQKQLPFPAPALSSVSNIAIPQNSGVRAVEISAVNTGATGPDTKVFVQAIGSGGDILKIWNPNVEIGMVPLPPGAVFLDVTNLDTHDAQISLTWGIDG